MGESAGAALFCEASPPHRVLVVDDEAIVRDLNSKMLRDAGYHADVAEDGAVAWDILQVQRYDLLVTDHKMPKVSGIELMEKIHVARILLPVILVTGTLPKEELDRQPWLQPAATIIKPYTVVEFLKTVKKVLCGPHSIADLQEVAETLNSRKSAQ